MAHAQTSAASRICDDDLVLAQHGALEVRLAVSPAEIKAATRLRHLAFRAESGTAHSDSDIETDRFDPLCDHIIVCDRAAPSPDGRPIVVGTYRALRPEATGIGFYSEAEFDLAPMLARHPHLRICEVGRSCVAPSHRSQPTLEALWRGLFVYAARHRIDVYFGAASFQGTDPQAHAMALSWLYHNAIGPDDWAVEANSAGAARMDLLPQSAIDSRSAMRHMPPLLRGYLKIGAYVGRTAFIDKEFNTTDVLVIAPLMQAPETWRRRFETMTGTGLGERERAVPIAADLL